MVLGPERRVLRLSENALELLDIHRLHLHLLVPPSLHELVRPREDPEFDESLPSRAEYAPRHPADNRARKG